MQVGPMSCGGIDVYPGEVVVGDTDGIVVGCVATMKRLLPLARTIQETEAKILSALRQVDEDTSSSSSSSPPTAIPTQTRSTLADLTNYEEHINRRLKGEESQLEFRI
jgi:hypothetical protein